MLALTMGELDLQNRAAAIRERRPKGQRCVGIGKWLLDREGPQVGALGYQARKSVQPRPPCARLAEPPQRRGELRRGGVPTWSPRSRVPQICSPSSTFNAPPSNRFSHCPGAQPRESKGAYPSNSRALTCDFACGARWTRTTALRIMRPQPSGPATCGNGRRPWSGASLESYRFVWVVARSHAGCGISAACKASL
jgi:hypothetical protein